MYQVNKLNEKLEWEKFALTDNKMDLYKTLRYSLGTQVQILYNDWYLTRLDGSLYQLDWLIENHDRLMNATNKAINYQKKYEEMKGKQKVKNGESKKY